MNLQITPHPIRIVAACAAALLAVVAVASAATDFTRFPFSASLAPAAATSNKIAAFQLTEEIFASTAIDYANLRVADERRAEVPCLVRRQTGRRTLVSERPVAGRVISAQPGPDNRLSIQLDVTESNRTPSVLVFRTSLKDYEKMVTVQASRNGDEWETVTEGAPIFDYSRFMDVRNPRVSVRPGPYRHYRIELTNIAEARQSPITQISKEKRSDLATSEIEHTSFIRQDFRIDGIDIQERLETVTEDQPIERGYPVSNLVCTNDPKRQVTVVTFDSPRAPLTSIHISTGAANFNRSASLESCDGDPAKAPWSTVAAGTLGRLDTGTYRQEQLALTFASTRQSHYRLTVRNQDNPPLEITAIEARGDAQEVIFFHEPARTYSLFFGGDKIPPARYDIAAILSRIPPASTDVFTLAPAAASPIYRIPKGLSPFAGKRMLLPVLIIVIITLGWLIATAVRKMDVPAGDPPA